MPENFRLIITRANEVHKTLQEHPVAAVLSIEHPGAAENSRDAAPRLQDVPQKILCFWDSEQKVSGGPDMKQVEEGVLFALEHLERGDVLIHCHAGKSRSVAIALGVLALRHPEKDEAALLEIILELRPVAAPNILVVEMVDALAGREGRLLAAVLAHPVISAQRKQAEENRQSLLKNNPELMKKIHPEKPFKP